MGRRKCFVCNGKGILKCKDDYCFICEYDGEYHFCDYCEGTGYLHNNTQQFKKNKGVIMLTVIVILPCAIALFGAFVNCL